MNLSPLETPVSSAPKSLFDLIAAVGRAPADAALHVQLADQYAGMGRWMPAIAEYRSAVALGGERDELETRIARCLSGVEAGRPINAMSHNLYFRTQWLARHIRELFPTGEFSLLDAGGGDGRLAVDLPTCEYVLAEPATNGIFISEELSFNRKFDIVVCCHVLEHIPVDARDAFLDQLCGMTNKYLVLLNPVVDSRIDLRQWQQSIYDITGGKWAKEHIDCIMPRLEDITSYAERRGYAHRVKPNGSKPLALAVVFLDHFAKSGKPEHVAAVNRMFNAIPFDALDNADWPNAYLVEMQVGK